MSLSICSLARLQVPQRNGHVDAGEDRADRLGEAGDLAARPDGQRQRRHQPPRQTGHVDHRLGVLPESEVPHVPDDTHDLVGAGRVERLGQRDAAAERAAAAEELPCEALVDDCAQRARQFRFGLARQAFARLRERPRGCPPARTRVRAPPGCPWSRRSAGPPSSCRPPARRPASTGSLRPRSHRSTACRRAGEIDDRLADCTPGTRSTPSRSRSKKSCSRCPL